MLHPAQDFLPASVSDDLAVPHPVQIGVVPETVLKEPQELAAAPLRLRRETGTLFPRPTRRVLAAHRGPEKQGPC